MFITGDVQSGRTTPRHTWLIGRPQQSAQRALFLSQHAAAEGAKRKPRAKRPALLSTRRISRAEVGRRISPTTPTPRVAAVVPSALVLPSSRSGMSFGRDPAPRRAACVEAGAGRPDMERIRRFGVHCRARTASHSIRRQRRRSRHVKRSCAFSLIRPRQTKSRRTAPSWKVLLRFLKVVTALATRRGARGLGCERVRPLPEAAWRRTGQRVEPKVPAEPRHADGKGLAGQRCRHGSTLLLLTQVAVWALWILEGLDAADGRVAVLAREAPVAVRRRAVGACPLVPSRMRWPLLPRPRQRRHLAALRGQEELQEGGLRAERRRRGHRQRRQRRHPASC